MHLKIRESPPKAPGESATFATERVFLRDGNHLDTPPLQPLEVVEVPDDEAQALLKAAPHILEPVDGPATRDLVNLTWEPSPLAKNAPVPDGTPAQKAENTKLRNRIKEQDAKIDKLTAAVEALTAAQAANPLGGLSPDALSGLRLPNEGDE